MRQIDGYTASNISATTAAFTLSGGLYGVTYSATWSSGSVTLERLSADGTTYIAVMTAFAANGYATVYLPPGTYELVVATSTAVYVNICRIPSE